MNPDAYQFHRPPNTSAHQFQGHYIISDQVGHEDLRVVTGELQTVLNAQVPGAVVEFGCYVGTTSQFIRRLLDQTGESEQRAFHVYDSFEGLPVKRPEDRSAAGVDFQPGKLSVGKKEFLAQFRAARLQPPIIHKGWFRDLGADDLPLKIAFAFLDGDFYDSILDSLKLVWPRMQPDGRVLIDDYSRAELPGVERAVRDFFRAQSKPMPPLRVTQNIAIINKGS